ncbi:carbohydrate ABC transporter permease [Paenibacillus sacheonensis]|uniref:ABC transporter permease subunit n=1 Tax=Paenibacillus sacheonensis TaxID=742054 RepID=A0A7X5C0U7_9BACL|nr:carbohydrate ABC transporter permease [Paenibacillus sacheonensis]MBM7565937.1 putative aldouronate transport system permease protein [Paenibacillus sacheonensis]NBC68749.1 ABC transporter permease subunit [Paenibacillus sacheonensis]
MKAYVKTLARRPLPAGKAIIHLIFLLLCAACLFPFLVIIGTSVQSENDIVKFGYAILPKHFTWDAYRVILHDPKALFQSYFVTIATTVIGSVVGMWVTTSYAYAISRKDYRFRSFLAFFVFFTMLFHGGMVPSYILMVKWLGLKNTMLALILPYLISGWFVMLMKGFLQTIPEAIIESAKIDGAGELRIFAQIVLPISKPALATLSLFFALQYWNDWWLTLLYVDHDNLMKLQYLLIRVLKNMEYLNSAEAIEYGLVKPGMLVPSLSARMAMCILAAGPMLLVFPLFQKYFVQGLTVGSVKG